MLQHLVQTCQQQCEPPDIAPLLGRNTCEQRVHRRIQRLASVYTVRGISPCQRCHLGETDVLPDQVLVHHPPIQTRVTLASGEDTRRNMHPPGVFGFDQKFPVGRQSAQTLHQFISALPVRLDPDRIAQPDLAQRHFQIAKIHVVRQTAVPCQLGRAHPIQRDQIGHQAQFLQAHQFMGQGVIFSPDIGLDLFAIAPGIANFADGRSHGSAPRRFLLQLGHVGWLRNGFVRQIHVEHAAFAAHASSSILSHAARTVSLNSS